MNRYSFVVGILGLSSCALLSERTVEEREAPQTMGDIIRAQDLVVGMRADEVLRSWGSPIAVEESSSDPAEEQRWVYRLGPSHRAFREVTPERIVYFREGRVVGWETSH